MLENKHAIGLLCTALFHASIVAIFAVGFSDEEALSPEFEEAVTIEASLAFKKVTRKNRQPQKQRKKKFKEPEAPKVAKDDTVKTKEKEKEPLAAKPDEIDPDSIFEKNRAQNEDLSSSGVDELPSEGQDDGSKWGTEIDAKGHKYSAQLKSNIYSVWTYPSISSDDGFAEGCVKLNNKGEIVKRDVKTGSNKDLNLSVRNALRKAPDMNEPVPEELRTLLTGKGICFSMSPSDR